MLGDKRVHSPAGTEIMSKRKPSSRGSASGTPAGSRKTGSRKKGSVRSSARPRKKAVSRRARQAKASRKIPLEQLIDVTAADMRKILARKEVRELLWRMANKQEEDGRPVARSARHMAAARAARKKMETRVRAAAVTQSSMRCFWYNFYMNVVKPVYGFRHLSAVQDQRGDVIHLDNGGALSDDGDFTFEMNNLDPPQSLDGTSFQTMHCEITPCNRQALQPFIDRLKQASLPVRVSVDGTLTVDAAHQGDPDLLEVHPVVAARFV
jgi:hypothetical protein